MFQFNPEIANQIQKINQLNILLQKKRNNPISESDFTDITWESNSEFFDKFYQVFILL